MRDFLNVFKQFKNEILPTTKKFSTENSNFQIINNKDSGRQAMKSVTLMKKISSLKARQIKTPYTAPRNIMPQFDMMPSIQYSIPRKSPVMIQTNLFEIPPLYQPEAMLDMTNLLLKPQEMYGINRNDRWQKEHENPLRHKSNYQVRDITQIEVPKDEKSRFKSKTINKLMNNNFQEDIKKNPSTFGLTLNNKPNLNKMLLKQISDMYLKDLYNKDTMDIKTIVPYDNNKMYDDIVKSPLNTEFNTDASKINTQWNSDFNSALLNKLTQKMQNQDKERYNSRLRSVLFKDTPNTRSIEHNSVKKTGGDYDVYTSKENNDNIDYNEFIKNIKAVISKGSPFQAQINPNVKSRNKDVYIDSIINRDLTSNMSFKGKNVYSKDRKLIEKRIKYVAKNKNTDDMINTITHFNDKTKIKINSQELVQSAKQTSIDVQKLLNKLKKEKFHMDSFDTPTMEYNSDSDKEMLKINSNYISKVQTTRNTISNPNLYQELLTNIQKDVLQFVQNKNSNVNDDGQNYIKINVKHDNSMNVNLSDSSTSAQNKVKDKKDMLMNNDIIDQLNNLVSKLKDAQYIQNVDNKEENKQTLSNLYKPTEAVYEHSTTKSQYENNTYGYNLESGTLHDISNTKLEATENLNLNKNINVYHDLVEKIKDGTIKSNNVQDIINEIIKDILDSKSKSNEDITKKNDVTNDLIIARIKDEVMKSDNFTDIFRGLIKQIIHSAPNQESATVKIENEKLNISSSKNNVSKIINDNIDDVTKKDTVTDNIDVLPKSDPVKANPSIYDELINQNFDFGTQQKNSPTENTVNMDIFNDLIGLNKVSSSPSTTITYKEFLSSFRERYPEEHLKNTNIDNKPNSELKKNPGYNNVIKQYIKEQRNTNSDMYKEFLKHSSVFGLKSNNNYNNMLELQTTPKPISDLFVSSKTIKPQDPYIMQNYVNKMDSPIKTSYDTESKTEEKYKDLKNNLLNPYKEEILLNQFKNKDNKRMHRKQPSKTNSDYDEIKIRNTYKYSDTEKSKMEAREHIQKIIDTLDQEIEERTKLQVNQRYQAPIRDVKRTRSRDDIHFKNFIKTQQKVNNILSKILANNSNKRSSVVTI